MRLALLLTLLPACTVTDEEILCPEVDSRDITWDDTSFGFSAEDVFAQLDISTYTAAWDDTEPATPDISSLTIHLEKAEGEPRVSTRRGYTARDCTTQYGIDLSGDNLIFSLNISVSNADASLTASGPLGVLVPSTAPETFLFVDSRMTTTTLPVEEVAVADSLLEEDDLVLEEYVAYVSGPVTAPRFSINVHGSNADTFAAYSLAAADLTPAP